MAPESDSPRRPYHLMVFHFAGTMGGAERTTLLLLRHLHATGAASVTMVGSELLRPVLAPYSTRYIDGNARGLGFWFTDGAGLYRDVACAAALLAEETPDLVLGMMHYGSALAVLGGHRQRCSVRTIASFRGPAYEYLIRYEPDPWRRLFLRAVIGMTGRLADRVLVPSAGTGRELTRRFLVPSRRIEVIPNGIDQMAVQRAIQEEASDLADMPTTRPVLCAVARLSSEKDLGLLLDAFGRIHHHHPALLLIIGDGPDRPGLEAQTKALGLEEAVRFVGYRNNVFPYLVRSDIFIHTCQFEGFGYTMLEAMACGLPVVATDCPYGPREVIDTEACGILVRPGDPEALARALLTLMDDPVLRHQLALGAQARAAALSLDAMMGRYVALFSRLAMEIPA